MISHDQRRAQLQARYAELEMRIVAIDAELDAEHSSDLEDLAIEHEDDEVLEGVGTSAQQEVRQIEAALERLELGEYGTCTICGDPIQEERLNVLSLYSLLPGLRKMSRVPPKPPHPVHLQNIEQGQRWVSPAQANDAVVPTQVRSDTTLQPSDAPTEDDQIEAVFDNMPV